MAYLTLNRRCVLKEDGDLWSNLPLGLVAERDKAHRNIYAQHGKELKALHQLFSVGCAG